MYLPCQVTRLLLVVLVYWGIGGGGVVGGSGVFGGGGAVVGVSVDVSDLLIL